MLYFAPAPIAKVKRVDPSTPLRSAEREFAPRPTKRKGLTFDSRPVALKQKISHVFVLRETEQCGTGTAVYRLGCGVGIVVVPVSSHRSSERNQLWHSQQVICLASTAASSFNEGT